MTMVLPVLGPAGLQRFRELRPAAIAAVTQRFYDTHGSIYEQFGPAGREACREDLAFHLEFLQPVIEFGELRPMVQYLRWLGSVLVAREIPAQHLGLSLDWLGQFFSGSMAPEDGAIVAAALAAARDAFVSGGPAQEAEGFQAPEAWPQSAAFEAELLAGNQRGASQVMIDALNEGHDLVGIEMHILQPALYRIGEKWQANEVSVAQEHLATAITQSAMSHGLLLSEPPMPAGRQVLLACVQGNGHFVGLQMVADAFQLAGWSVQFLGANVPTAALVGQVQKWKPDLVGLSVSFPHQLRVVKDIMGRLAGAMGDARPRVMVGGLAINRFDGLAALVGADAWSPDSASAVTTGSALLGPLRPG